jgi:ABC-type Fe2+-enterobactin transport system substrate-binding protein
MNYQAISRTLTYGILSVVLLFTAHGYAANTSSDTWPRQITSQGGGAITLAHKPLRIVSTSVTLTGTLLAIDAPVIASAATSPNSPLADKQGFFRQWADIAKARAVQPLYIGEPNAEAIASQSPDLIVVAASGGDSALKIYDQLKTIAPTLVVDYDHQSWQSLAQQLAQATGQETQAQARIDEFSTRANALKQQIKLPPQPVNALVYHAEGKLANLWTPQSAQGQLLQQLGFTLAEVPNNLTTQHSFGKRQDIIQLAGEQLAPGLQGNTLLLFAAEAPQASALAQNPLLAQQPAVINQRVYALGNSSFRLDYYSASQLLERLRQLFAQ